MTDNMFEAEAERLLSLSWTFKVSSKTSLVAYWGITGAISKRGFLVGHMPSRRNTHLYHRLASYLNGIELYRGWWLFNDEIIQQHTVVLPDGTVVNGLDMHGFEGTSGEYLRLYLKAVDRASGAYRAESWIPGKVHECPTVITAHHLVEHQMKGELCHRAARLYSGPWNRYRRWQLEFDEKVCMDKWEELNA